MLRQVQERAALAEALMQVSDSMGSGGEAIGMALGEIEDLWKEIQRGLACLL